LAKIDAASGAVTANRVRSNLSALFTWGMKEGVVLGNPVIGTVERPEQARDRVLNNKEIVLVWQCLPADNFGDIVRLLILTGQRAREISDLRWSEIVDGRIELPRERTKNDRAHTIPLGPMASAILERRVRRPNSTFVFSSRADAPFSDFGLQKKKLDARIAELTGAPFRHFVIHDIRRSVATGMADIGIQPHIIEAVLNHVSGHKGGVAGIYNRSSYAAEKAAALARWDEHVALIVSGVPQKWRGI
jgi:integrase